MAKDKKIEPKVKVVPFKLLTIDEFLGLVPSLTIGIKSHFEKKFSDKTQKKTIETWRKLTDLKDKFLTNK